jgi:hypothetical protein
VKRQESDLPTFFIYTPVQEKVMKVKLTLSLDDFVIDRIKRSKWDSPSEYVAWLVQKDALIGTDALKEIDSKLDELLRREKL